MRYPTIWALITLVGLASSASAEIPRHGQFDCVLSGEGACGEGPEAVCLGNRVRRGGPTVFLKLNFDENRAELNGINGVIHRNSVSGANFIYWADLIMLESPTIAAVVSNGATFVVLQVHNRTATFACQQAR